VIEREKERKAGAVRAGKQASNRKEKAKEKKNFCFLFGCQKFIDLIISIFSSLSCICFYRCYISFCFRF